MMSQVAQQMRAALCTRPQGLQRHACFKALQRFMNEVSLHCLSMKVCKGQFEQVLTAQVDLEHMSGQKLSNTIAQLIRLFRRPTPQGTSGVCDGVNLGGVEQVLTSQVDPDHMSGQELSDTIGQLLGATQGVDPQAAGAQVSPAWVCCRDSPHSLLSLDLSPAEV